MKIRIKTYNGELPSYLTVGKVYEAGYHDDEIFQKIDDVTQKMRGVVENGGSAFDIVESFNLGEGIAMKHSDFKIGDAVVRRWNNKVYYIIADVDNDKWEALISEDNGAKVKHCKVCETYSNLRYATQDEIRDGYAESF